MSYLTLDLALAHVGWCIHNSECAMQAHGEFDNPKVHDDIAYDIPYRAELLIRLVDRLMTEHPDISDVIYESIFFARSQAAAIAAGASLGLIGYLRTHFGNEAMHSLPAKTMKKEISSYGQYDPKARAKIAAHDWEGIPIDDLGEHEADAICIFHSWRKRNISTNPFD